MAKYIDLKNLTKIKFHLKKLENVSQNHDLDFDDVLQLHHHNSITHVWAKATHIKASTTHIFLYHQLTYTLQTNKNSKQITRNESQMKLILHYKITKNVHNKQNSWVCIIIMCLNNKLWTLHATWFTWRCYNLQIYDSFGTLNRCNNIFKHNVHLNRWVSIPNQNDIYKITQENIVDVG